MSRRAAEALPLLEQALDRLPSTQMMIYQPLLLISVSETCLLAGRTDEATRHAEQAVRVSTQRGDRGTQAHAFRLLGESASHRDPPDAQKAEGDYRQALALADELGMRPLVAHCHLGLGKLHRRTGKREQAREHLTTATTLYREMDMRFWTTQAEAALEALS
jgi:tetratricopeptide (TPR) repeat protein